MKYSSFRNELPDGFDKTECPTFDLEIPTDDTWGSKNYHRILVVMEHVDSMDLKNGRLLSSSPGKDAFRGILRLAEEVAANAGEKVFRYSLACVNFNYFKTYHLKSDQEALAHKHAARRVLSYIKKMNPHTVLIIGDTAARSLLPNVEHIQYKRGWVHELEIPSKDGPKKFKAVNTIGYNQTYIVRQDADDDEEENERSDMNGTGGKDQYETAVTNANLVGYISRTVSTALTRKVIYDASHVKAKYRFVTSVKKFREMMAEIKDAPYISVDTETSGLHNYGINVYTIQFATSDEFGWVVPLEHPDTPFNVSELKEIKKELRAFFAQKMVFNPKKPRYLLGQNFGFDLRILRQWLSIPVIHWPVWDVTAGEYCLDENIKVLSRYGTKPYELHHIFARYNNAHYFGADFGKEDRHTLGSRKLEKDVLDYCSMDVQCLVAIHKQQLRRAEHLHWTTGNYKKAYWRFVLATMSPIIHTMSTMEHRGAQLDAAEFMRLLGAGSPIDARVKELKAELFTMPSVKEANKRLLKGQNIPSTGLFGKTNTWVFDLSTTKHKQLLFFDVLGLKPLSEGENGPSLDKNFKKTYEKVREVALFDEYEKLLKIKGTYVEGWYKKLSADPDGRVDMRLRPRFGYKDVVTGRSNSSKPNLQNVPEHSKQAKYIKRLFRAPIGYLKLDADYSAHEVRCWGLVAKDTAVAAAFQSCLNLIYSFRRKSTVEAWIRVESEADIHKVNYSSFTGVPVREVTKPQRQDSKGITFGNIYGMSLGSLAKSIKRTKDEAKVLVTAFFAKFAKASKWLEWAVSFSNDNYYVFSPIGRRRNLPGYVVPIDVLKGAFERRARNSPIQGMGSDFGFIAARLFTIAMQRFMEEHKIESNEQWFKKWGYEKYLTEFDKNKAFLPCGVDTMVHDSMKNQARYDLFYVSQHLLEWAMIDGVREYVNEYFGFDFVVDLAVEMEVGAAADKMEKWTFANTDLKYTIKEKVKELDKEGKEIEVEKPVEKEVHSLPTLVRRALERQKKEFNFDIDVSGHMKEMTALYKTHREWLDANYPRAYSKWVAQQEKRKEAA